MDALHDEGGLLAVEVLSPGPVAVDRDELIVPGEISVEVA
jgi:hypothetical protein